MRRLKPSLSVNGNTNRLVANIAAERDTIVDALDFVMQGF